jgi:polyisoprenoid-binding protein YceI
MKINKISADELRTWLETDNELILLDLMNPEFYAEEHIDKALNAPIYEVAFLSYVEKIINEKNSHIVIYDDNVNDYATADAASKLNIAGYENVDVLSVPLREWKKLGNSTVKGEPIAKAIAKDGIYMLDTEKSIVGWTGRNAKYAHRGKIMIKEGGVEIRSGKLVDGKIILDMNTISDDDLLDQTWKGVLESHLKSSDFFDVKKYPEAVFAFGSVKEIPGALAGEFNHEMEGILTIKDISKAIKFNATIIPQVDGSINGQAHFDFDRTLWNVRYGSEKFFEKLGMHLVNDIISLDLFLVAKP